MIEIFEFFNNLSSSLETGSYHILGFRNKEQNIKTVEKLYVLSNV